ncbi:hypothetical protein THRCLA_11566 [Thraustotheca clavata]|uniref:Uncharacterized protein n=1 Tax=Thraustotheca clavata TaxID=74557 RepID=A0A1V9Y7D4_9STRA|nr:hypothetical protein THRCLA_11566 [Thraustotheca clavata]
MAGGEKQNANPTVYAVATERRVEEIVDEDTIDEFDALEVFEILRHLNDPEHPLTLEQLKVMTLDNITVNNKESSVKVSFTPTIPHCSMATLIGLCIRVKLLRSLPKRFKVDIHITPGTHITEDAINKQLNDKERVAAALENAHLLNVVNKSRGFNRQLNQCVLAKDISHGRLSKSSFTYSLKEKLMTQNQPSSSGNWIVVNPEFLSNKMQFSFDNGIFGGINVESIVGILGYLDGQSLVAISQVCRELHLATKDDALWLAVCRAEWGVSPSQLKQLNSIKGKELYQFARQSLRRWEAALNGPVNHGYCRVTKAMMEEQCLQAMQQAWCLSQYTMASIVHSRRMLRYNSELCIIPKPV